MRKRTLITVPVSEEPKAGWLGVDPGASGGFAMIREDVHGVFRVDAWALASLTLMDTFRIFQICSGFGIRMAALEYVSAMPRQGVSSTFKFGKSYGHLEMGLTAAGIPFERVTPTKWQRALGCLSKGDKNVTKRRAQELFPSFNGITHAIADSLLLAEYARRFM